jgi:uncharacterized phosphosugar-binding protein
MNVIATLVSITSALAKRKARTIIEAAAWIGHATKSMRKRHVYACGGGRAGIKPGPLR